MIHLAAALEWAQHRSAIRGPVLRPELKKLDQILKAIIANPRQKIPVAMLMVFAIFSARRLGEICRLRWEDLKIAESKVLVVKRSIPARKRRTVFGATSLQRHCKLFFQCHGP